MNVISFHDPVIDGSNMEDTDLYEWQRRPGFSIFCPIPLADREIVNQFYSSRNLNGTVLSFADTTQRLTLFTSTTLLTILTKTTTSQGYITTLGNMTYFSDSAAVDLFKWDSTNLSVWGLAAPTIVPKARYTADGLGFWQPLTTFDIGDSILDPNGNLESVSAILIPNGGFKSPTAASTLALGGSLVGSWTFDAAHGGFEFVDGYNHVQQIGIFSSTATGVFTFPAVVTVGNTILVSFGEVTTNFIPTVTSVTDSLGNVYTQQHVFTGLFAGGGGNNFYYTEWVWSAPVSIGGSCTVTVQLSAGNVSISAHEFGGISAAATTSAHGFVTNSPTINTGTVTFAGTQLVVSSLFQGSTGGIGAPSGYIHGASSGSFGSPGTNQLDAYLGTISPQSPTWSIFAANDNATGVTTVYPISSFALGFTPYLFLRDFNFAVPAGSTIVGIAVTVPKFNVSGAGVVQDHSVKLVIGGVAVGVDHASATTWSNSGYAVTTYGGPTDTWGLTPSATDINTNGLSGFGLAISAQIVSGSGSVVPEVGFVAPNQVTITIYFQQANGLGGPGVSGVNEPVWPTTINGTVNDGGITWTNYGPILAWFPTTGYPTPVVILDANGNLELSTHISNPIPPWNNATAYPLGSVVYFGGQYWISIFNGSNTNVVPSVSYTVTTAGTTVPYWALTTTPLVTGLIAPVWNTTLGGVTQDGSYTWTNLGPGVGLAFVGHSYVYAYRTIYGHLTTGSPFSNNTGAILGPLNGSITSFTIASNVVTFTGNNNFLPGNIFLVNGLTSGTFLNTQSFTVLTSTPSSTFPLTSVQVTNANILIIQAINNLVAGQTVTFSGVGTATFLNGVTVTVISTGLSSTQFEANFTHAAYGPTVDSGSVTRNGSYTASFTHPDVSTTLDSGVATPLIATISGVGTGSPLCNSVATITAIKVVANIVTLTASNNFQPGLWVTFNGLTGATFLNGQQLQVISVDKPVGTQNTQFQVFFQTPNYILTSDFGTATFNAVEIYRTSDGGGLYLFDGAVTNPGLNLPWTFNDFVIDDNLDALLIAPLGHQNDPPPGAPGSLVQNTGNITAYWQGRLWIVVGNFVYFDAGPDCTNGIPEESWPPSNRFQYAGSVLNIIPSADGGGLLVYLADRVAVILGGPETISFYSMDALSNFGISNPNAVFKDGSIIGQFVTQKQYIELVGAQKNDVGEHIGDYLANRFDSAKSYVTLHRNGLDVGVFISNGVDRIVRYGSNISAWSVPAFPSFGAGALRSIETSVGVYSLMLASPTGGTTITTGFVNPISGTSIAGTGIPWTNPGVIVAGNPTTYTTVLFPAAGSSQILRAAFQVLNLPNTAIVRGIQVSITGKQADVSGNTTVNITPTNPAFGAETHTFSFGTSNTTVVFGGLTDLWGMAWSIPSVLNSGVLSFDLTATFTGVQGAPNAHLGSAGTYAILASAGVTNTGATVIAGGNVGSFPTNTIIGLTGANYIAPAATVTATAQNQTDLTAAFTFFNGLTSTAIGASFANTTFTATATGYNGGPGFVGKASSTLHFTGGTITLDGANLVNPTFVFQVVSALNIDTAATTITLINGAKADNVIWVVGSAATFDAHTHIFAGNILATSAITLNGGSLAGRALVTTGPVTISSATTITATGNGTSEVDISQVQVAVTYQNPGNFIYARDLNSWGDGGAYGQNNGQPYALCNIVIGSITLAQLGAPGFPLQHIVGYFNAVGTLQNGMPSQPDIWILPNEVNDTSGIGFIQLPEVLNEPPVGQNIPSATILALRYPINMMNSQLASQYMHHLQVKIQFEPENAPNTIKAIAFMESQQT